MRCLTTIQFTNARNYFEHMPWHFFSLYLEKDIKCSCHRSNLLRKPHHRFSETGNLHGNDYIVNEWIWTIQELCVWHIIINPKYIYAQLDFVEYCSWFDLIYFHSKNIKSVCCVFNSSVCNTNHLKRVTSRWNSSRHLKWIVNLWTDQIFIEHISFCFLKQNNYETDVRDGNGEMFIVINLNSFSEFFTSLSVWNAIENVHKKHFAE